MSATPSQKTFSIKNRAGVIQQTKQNKTIAAQHLCQQGDRGGSDD